MKISHFCFTVEICLALLISTVLPSATSCPWAVKVSWLENTYSRPPLGSFLGFDWYISQTDPFIGMWSGLISRPVHVILQVTVCSDDNFCYPVWQFSWLLHSGHGPWKVVQTRVNLSVGAVILDARTIQIWWPQVSSLHRQYFLWRLKGLGPSKIGQGDLVINVVSGFIHSSVQARLQVSMCKVTICATLVNIKTYRLDTSIW